MVLRFSIRLSGTNGGRSKTSRQSTLRRLRKDCEKSIPVCVSPGHLTELGEEDAIALG
jgi:hypothetical protein